MPPSPQNVEPAALFVIAGASCSGKNSLLSRLLEAHPELARPVTTTTRPPRAHEEDGVHYHFVSEAEFRAGVDAGAFVEHAEVHGALYGLTHRALERVRSHGDLPVVILDVQGVQAVSRKLPVASLFVDVPLDQLARRLRQHRPADEIETRMASAAEERARRFDFDRVIRNPDGEMEAAAEDLIRYYRDEVRPRLRRYEEHDQRRIDRAAGRRP